MISLNWILAILCGFHTWCPKLSFLEVATEIWTVRFWEDDLSTNSTDEVMEIVVSEEKVEYRSGMGQGVNIPTKSIGGEDLHLCLTLHQDSQAFIWSSTLSYKEVAWPWMTWFFYRKNNNMSSAIESYRL